MSSKVGKDINCHFTAETGESVLILKGPQGRINRAVWGPLNRTIISAGEDAVIRIWDSEVSGWNCSCGVCIFILEGELISDHKLNDL